MADVDRVRTPAGVRRFELPIGSPIPKGGSLAGKARTARKALARLDGRANKVHAAPSKPTPEVPKVPKPKTPEQSARGRKPEAVRTARKALQEVKSRQESAEHRMGVRNRKNAAKNALERNTIVRGPGPWDPEDGYEKRGEWVDKGIKGLLDAGKSTDVQYKKAKHLPGGKRVEVYTPERAELHEKIMAEMWKRGNADSVPRERKALFTGGAGGSGKGFVLKTAGIKEGEDYVTVNADEVKEIMAEWNLIPVPEGISQMEGVALVHEESSDIATEFAARLQREGVNMIWDITMSGPGQVMKRITKLKENGYEDIRGMYVDVPIEVSVENAKSRYANGMNRLASGESPIGGRRVPPAVILSAQSDVPGVTKNKLAFEAVRDQFTVAERWDNNRYDEDGNKLPPKRVD